MPTVLSLQIQLCVLCMDTSKAPMHISRSTIKGHTKRGFTIGEVPQRGKVCASLTELPQRIAHQSENDSPVTRADFHSW